MASAFQPAPAAEADRRNGPRAEICLGVTLRRAGSDAVIPAEITNLSATGFLAEFLDEVEVPPVLDVELPHAGSRTATVVWTSGCMAGCSFTQSLTKSEISAAHLKSEPLQMQAKLARAYAAPPIDPADPIWDTSSEAKPGEKWSLRKRLLVIGGAGLLPWLSIAGLVALLA